MKNLIFIAVVLFSTLSYAQQSPQTKYEYQIITTVESIVPSGIGRSRMISDTAERDFEDYTSDRTGENDERNKSDRKNIRVKEFSETKLLNFYALAGIRFQNIAANDAVVTSKLNDMATEGWELTFVNSGVESKGSADDDGGIFITRYIFRRVLN